MSRDVALGRANGYIRTLKLGVDVPITDARPFPAPRTSMDSLTNAIVQQAGTAELSRIQGTAAVLVMKKALDMQTTAAAQLLQALPQQPLAASGTLGTLLNTYA